MTEISRRQVLAGATASVAAAALPAAVIEVVSQSAKPVTYLDPATVAWTPGRLYMPRELITIGDRFHVVFISHISEDAPSDCCISGPLRRDEHGRLVEHRPDGETWPVAAARRT